MAQLEVFELFPDYFAPLNLNIPETKGVPDILTEVMWEVDCFRRLQNADGGVGYGIESKGDPLPGEVSWLNSFPSYVFAADYANSWFYAAVGAQLSYLLQKYDAKLAATYRDSAARAFVWAEKDYAAAKASGDFAKQYDTWHSIDSRNLAALQLYRLTRGKPYHDIFLQDTVLQKDNPDLFQWGQHVQRDQAFLYARLPAGLGEEALKKNAVAGLKIMADRALNYAEGNAFNITTPDKGKPQFIGFYSTPDATDLTRAHYLTGEEKYLIGAVQATQFQSGCNPNNMVYTTGLGANPVQNAFKLDARRTGQKTPAGLTPYGNIDFSKWNNAGITWPITWYLGKITTPNPYAWPTNEAYWDLGAWPMLEEFTVDSWAPNVQVWGYLAARQ
jgi:endoglucanase